MDNSIEIKDLNKVFKLYNKSTDRFKESMNPFRKSYHTDYYALKDVSFSVKQGETIGIVGKNGSGKSTLLKILTGVLTPSSGEVNIHGKISALLELGAGFNNDYTGYDNIFLNGSIQGIRREEMQKKVDSIIKFADIGEYIYQPVKTYSSGMFVRLAFAVAINVDPDILIIDEALAVGDTRFQLKCMDKFLEFKEKGLTIIYVSHDINSVKRFCDRTLWINNGRLEADGDTDLVTDMYLDYLKKLDAVGNEEAMNPEAAEPENQEECGESEELRENVDIAEIEKVTIINKFGRETNKITHGERVQIKVDYYVRDENVKNPVLGVAILRIDNLYICGVNTLLDHKEIPWKRGMNSYVLTYESFNLVGGSYYFDVALFDQTATVPIDYRSKFKEFFVKMDYIAEGITVLSHKWN